jgi:hypothetical protein
VTDINEKGFIRRNDSMLLWRLRYPTTDCPQSRDLEMLAAWISLSLKVSEPGKPME